MDDKITRHGGKRIFRKRGFKKEESTRQNTQPSLLDRDSFRQSRNQAEVKERVEKPDTQRRSGWIGTDESGKGDYFGPLVVAGVYVDGSLIAKLKELKVRDSKKISDGVIRELDFKIRSMCRYSVVVIGPEKYNLLYSRMKNLNRMLAWGHARVIENILLQVDSPRALSDQFGDEQYIRNALMKLGKKIRLEQRPGAESDLAVAAASILARAEFVNRLERLSQDCGLDLPKGASPLTEEAARKLVEKLGKENLEKYVKLHFKNTNKVLFPQKEESTQTQI
jgi:ribonuclease HIII